MMTATAGQPEAERESDIPAGYAYLLQFAVHDTVDSKPPLTTMGVSVSGPKPSPYNTTGKPGHTAPG